MAERKLIASLHCREYTTDAKLYIEDTLPGQRHLVAEYETGGYGGAPEFAAAIPNDWSDEDVIDLILWPMKSPSAPYPAWEVPARAYGSETLFRWWAGERPS